MSDTIPQIRAAVMNGLTRPEIEGLLDRKLDEDEVRAFNQTKAVTKLKSKLQKSEDEEPAMQPTMPKPSIQQRYTTKEVKAAVERCQGLTSPLMRALDCTYYQLHTYYDKHPDIAQMAEQCRMQVVAKAEENISDLLRSADPRVKLDATKFVLSRLDASRWAAPLQKVETKTEASGQTITVQSIFGLPQ